MKENIKKSKSAVNVYVGKMQKVYEYRKALYEGLAKRAQTHTSELYYEARLSEVTHVLNLLERYDELEKELAEVEAEAEAEAVRFADDEA